MNKITINLMAIEGRWGVSVHNIVKVKKVIQFRKQ